MNSVIIMVLTLFMKVINKTDRLKKIEKMLRICFIISSVTKQQP